jgi:hypothetical protein
VVRTLPDRARLAGRARLLDLQSDWVSPVLVGVRGVRFGGGDFPNLHRLDQPRRLGPVYHFRLSFCRTSLHTDQKPCFPSEINTFLNTRSSFRPSPRVGWHCNAFGRKKWVQSGKRAAGSNSSRSYNLPASAFSVLTRRDRNRPRAAWTTACIRWNPTPWPRLAGTTFNRRTRPIVGSDE